MGRVAYFDCPSGVSGNMALGALLACGCEAAALRNRLEGLRLGEWSLRVESVSVNGIGALHVEIEAEPDEGHGRHLHQIEEMIAQAELPTGVCANAVRVFRRLGAAEAAIHGVAAEELHFHEVGALDAIIDIVGTCMLLDELGVTHVACSPLPMGHGLTRCMHGVIPLPAPAVVELTRGVPTYGVPVEGELVTPTGAALMAELADEFGPQPAMVAEAAGYGAGTRRLEDRPNVLRVVVGSAAQRADAEVVVIETNIDDLSPQLYDVAVDRLFAAGALDVFMTPIQMKKNRPATLLSVICPPSCEEGVVASLFTNTTTIGVRMTRARRTCMERDIVPVQTPYGAIRVKVAAWGDDITKLMPEYDDIREAALRSGVPAMRVSEAAVAAYRAQGERP